MQWLLYGFAVVAGILNAVQSGCNATLGKSLQIPFVAALTIVAVSLSSLLLAGAVFGQLSWPGADKIGQVPWWAWFGGVLGATYVMSQLLVAQRIGAAAYMGLTVTAAVVASVMLDHFGWLGFKEHPIGVWRLVGVVLMIGGVGLVSKF